MPTIIASPSSASEIIHTTRAPGEPGLPARWTSAHKDGVGASAGTESDVWFTLSHGILNEIYFPRQDQANTRDFGFVVTADDGFFSEEKRDTHHEMRPLEDGVPGYVLTNTCREGRFRIQKVVIADPFTDSVLTAVRFEPLTGKIEDYRLYALLAPHLENHGGDNEGWCGDYHGDPMLFAQRGRTVLALASSAGWLERTCGFVGESDGWQQLHRCGRLDGLFDEAGPGNIALTGRVDLAACGGAFVCAVAFGHSPAEAGLSARLSLARGFAESCEAYVAGWRAFQKTCRRLASGRREAFNLYRVSTAVLHLHESRRFPGGVIASLAIPWGNFKGDDDMGAYHFVWPRDQWHAATGLLAAGLRENARSVLLAQMGTQSADGSWPQNMWLDGSPHRDAIQHDQLGGFLLLAELLRSENWLGGIDCWSAMRRTACYLIDAGPATQQDRWEDSSGYTPYSLAVVIAGLIVAAEWADRVGEPDMADLFRDAADDWNASIERWLYVTDTPLSRQFGVEGYYVRVAPKTVEKPADLHDAEVWLSNQNGHGAARAWEIVSVDALALVRYGLRSADDPRILNTIKVIDATLGCSTRSGPAWRRYTRDGYGEDHQGGAYDGKGVGRCWPLLTGERAHYEIARGDLPAARRLMRAMGRQASPSGLLPEQIWDGDNLPERGLRNGGPTGSAMPLVWAHAEFVTLLRSLRERRVIDCPAQTVNRYLQSDRRSVRGRRLRAS